MSWLKLLDDLEPDQVVKIDCGDTLVAGKFKRMVPKNGKWFLEIERANNKKILVRTDEIEGMRLVAMLKPSQRKNDDDNG